jgi:hypothetical protein
MTITASPLTVTRRNAAVSASAWFHTTDPGEFAVTYPTGITGPATVEAAGSRVWGNMGAGGDYLAYPSIGQDREDVTWLFEIDYSKIPSGNRTTLANAFPVIPIATCIRTDALSRSNWAFFARRYVNNTQNAFNIVVSDSPDNSTVPSVCLFGEKILASFPTTPIKFAITKATGGAHVLHWGVRGPHQSGTRPSTGTMGGTEVMIFHQAVQFSKISRVCSSAELDAWFASGTVPVSDREFAYLGGHEITANKIFDSGPNAYDLYAYQVEYYQAPGMIGDYTDTGFTSPLVEVPITIAADCTAGTHNITLRRTRVGIPTRVPALSDAVLYDDGTLPVTVAVETEVVEIGPDIDCQVPSYPHAFDLLLSGTYDGAATVVSDDANLVPTSPVTITDGVATVPCVASADITAATVTATGPGGDTGTCSVTVSEVPESTVPIKVGPSQTVRRGSTTISVHISGQDGVVTLASTPHGLDCPASATISGGEVDVAIPIMSVGTYTITATQGVLSDTAVVIVPGNYQATEDYDLVQDIADVIEDMIPASGNAYHYDEIVIGDDGRLDAEDHVFGVRVVGAIEGPIVGGKTIMVEVAVVSFPQVSPADVEALQNYLSQEADWPAYVGAVVCNQVQVNELNGGDIVIYQLEVILG